MKIVKTQEQVTYTKEVVKFVAEDGTEFEQEWRCRDYEREKAIDALGKIANSPPELDGFAPFDGNENMEEHSYRWFYIDSEETLESINEAYALDQYQTLGESELGEWVCIETNDCGDAWFSRLSNCIDYAKNVLGKLGFEMTVTKKEEQK